MPRLSLRSLRRLDRRSAGLLAMLLVLLLAAPLAFLYIYRPEEPPAQQRVLPDVSNLEGISDAAAVAYLRAAVAFEEGDLESAQGILDDLARRVPEETALARTLIGLYAYESGFMPTAIEALSDAEAVGGVLEDWRLFALADAAQRVERPEVAVQSLRRLLDQVEESPLRGRAFVQAAELAWQRGDAAAALGWINEARSRPLTRRVATEADRLAWTIGKASDNRAVMEEAARRLLIDAPPVARELQVADLFRDEQGRIESWDGVLTPDQVVQRARSWVELDAGRSAQNTLETLPPQQQDLEWHLLMSEALTLQRQGRAALDVLQRARPRSPAERAAVEWQRARATAELATVRRGRSNLSQAARGRMLAASVEHLENVVESGGDRELSIQALRQLYGYLAEEGLFDQAMEKLRMLRRLDPEDRTGAQSLWERGWRDYQRGNYTGAVGYWTELEELYPDVRETRPARYWKARAFDELGHDERAQEAYRQVLAESAAADFYFGRAAARYRGDFEPPLATGRSGSQQWQLDGPLARVVRLAELGLVGLARTELTLAREQEGTDPRAVMALDGIIRVRSGNPREGVALLRGAFPELASPYQGDVPGPVLAAYYPFLYGDTIEKHAERTGLPPHLVAGIIRQESAFDVRAESWAGARGLMQLMPATAREVAGKLGQAHTPSKLFDPEYSILLGSTYFAETLRRFDGNVELALAGYNGGPNRMRRLWREAGPDPELDYWLETLKISESQSYVKRILVLADSYRQLHWPDAENKVVASTAAEIDI
ncbi:MAG TPA: transglycosylase SLT domain-containing protein [Thermoanaerobaculia bacterium]|nr:transglycosylase SLT domain-containing protein [Thermoanaerobaculia bacterium]